MMQLYPCLSIVVRSFWLVVACIVLSLTQSAFAWQTVEYSDVKLGQKTLFSVTNTTLMSASDRAEEISDRLSSILSDPSADPSQLALRTGINGVPVVSLGDKTICYATAQDAEAFGESQRDLTQKWFEQLRDALLAAKPGHSSQSQPRSNSDLSEHAVLLLFLEIALLLVASLVCGEIMIRLGQPAILGQMIAGLLLGQTVFGSLFPDISAWLFPQDGSQSKLIEVVSWIGVSFLLMLTGMETDLSGFKRLGKPAAYFGLIGLAGPFAVGAVMSLLVPSTLLAGPNEKLAFAVFLGTVFATASVPTVAELLIDMKLMRRDIGKLVLSAALSHDLLSCLLLAVIAMLASSGPQDASPVLMAVLGTLAFVAVMYFGRPIFFTILRWVNDKVVSQYGLITAIVAILFLSAASTEALGIHIVLGAFAAGVILSQTPVVNSKLVKPLQIVTMSFFAPLFYAAAELNVNLAALLQPNLILLTLALSVGAILSKLLFCYWSGKLTNVGMWESLSVGIGSNVRGSMGIILGMLGYTLNIITDDMFAVIIFVSLVSTALAPVFLKWSLAKVQTTDEENIRIDRQEREARTMLSSVRRVLWPTSGKGRNLFIAKLLNSIGKHHVIETTLLNVRAPHSTEQQSFEGIAQAVDHKDVGLLQRTIRSDNPIDAITEEANRGYDLIVMTEDQPSADVNHVFGNKIDQVILNTSTRALIVHTPEHYKDKEIKRVLIPVSGSELSLSAGEFGISLAHALDAKVTCVCVEQTDAHDLYSDKTRSGEKIEQNITNEIEGSLSDLAKALNVDFEAVLLPTTLHPSKAIILAADQHHSDLIVLGAEPKLGKALFLGHTINYILRHPPCAVIVLKL